MTDRTASTATAIIPCNDVDASEAWWGRRTRITRTIAC